MSDQVSPRGDDEVERLRRVYANYDSDSRELRKRDAANPGLVEIEAERSRVLSELLGATALVPLQGKRILDVGCGFGRQLEELVAGGADAELCVGIDALEDRVARARREHPQIRFLVADARKLPFADAGFDVVLANLVFGSILDDDGATAVANEILRVLKPMGAIIWWENRYPTPGNPNVRGYRLARIRGLFPGAEVDARRTTLLPPIARRLGRAAPRLYPILSRIPILQGRYLAIVRRGPTNSS